MRGCPVGPTTPRTEDGLEALGLDSIADPAISSESAEVVAYELATQKLVTAATERVKLEHQ